jgi:hypothetical protein
MKKFIAVAAMLSVMFFGFGDVPGTDILAPWIYVSMPGFGGENTLITITEVKGVPTNLFLWLQDIDSVTVFNTGTKLTPFDVYVTDGLTLINAMSPLAAAALEIDTDGDGVNDHWAGYIYYFNITTVIDNLISNVYQVWLSGGMAASLNGVSWEFDTAFTPARQIGIFGDEAFSANALWEGKNLLEFAATAPFDANFFRLMARYFILDPVGQSLLMIWTEANLTGIPVPGLIHCVFFDESEFALSGNIPLKHELNIINVRTVLPVGLFAGYPWGGWIDITTPDMWGNGWFTDVNFNGILDGAERQWLGYSWQRAINPIDPSVAWEVIHPMHRETND